MFNKQKVYMEAWLILNLLKEEDFNKIPLEILEAIEANVKEQELDKYMANFEELKAGIMLPETKALLFNLFRDYLATPEQRRKIIDRQREERYQNELRKKQKYDVKNIFL